VAAATSAGRGIRLAVEERNAAGGVRGTPVALRSADAGTRPEAATTAASRLLAVERVHLLLADPAPPRALAMAPVADRHEVPLLAPAATDARVTREGGRERPFVFRAGLEDRGEAAAMARFAREQLKLGAVAVLRDGASDGSVRRADAFLAAFTALGGQVVDDQSYRTGDQDVRPQLAALRRKKPEALYLPGGPEAALVARQARELGMAQPLLGGLAWASPRLLAQAYGALEGCYYPAAWAPDAPGEAAKAFERAYTARWGSPPDAEAAAGYDAARLGLDALARAAASGGVAGPRVRDALQATRGFAGLAGPVALGPGHDARRPVLVLRIEGAAARWAATVLP
jgi:branched-chain amino acid transport system substrate-binding protein